MILFLVGAVGQVCAEEKVTTEGFEQLQVAVFSKKDDPDPPNLANHVLEFAGKFQGSERIKLLKEYLFDYPGHDHRSKILAVRRRLILIAAYENFLDDVEGKAKPLELEHARTMTRVLYLELRSDFKPKALPCFALLAVGDFLREETENPKQARIYYDEVLKRESGKSDHPQAWLGIAAVAALGDAKEKAIALQTLEKIRTESTQPKVIEEVLAQSIFLHSNQSNHKEVIELAKQYLKNKTFRRYSFEVRSCLADSYRDLDRVDDALSVYAQIWSGVNFRWAGNRNALYEWMKLLWKRNKPGDRQLAYERGFDFVNMTANAIKKAKPETRAEWEKIADLVKEYAKSPDTREIVEQE